jgi:hypothetical protein
VPLLAYVHSRPGERPERSPWEPDWRVWRPLLSAVTAALAASRVAGAAAYVLVVAAFGLGCRALDAALPYRDGLREWRQ